VVRASTTTALAVSPNPANAGQAVTLRATVSAASGTPTGMVRFMDGAAVLTTAPIGADGSAVISTSSLPAGAHVLAASYAGDANYNASTSAGVTLVVHGQMKATTTTLSTSSKMPKVGQLFTLKAVVKAASGVPTGRVRFFRAQTALGEAVLEANGSASIVVSLPTAGAFTFTAQYTGDAQYAPSQSPAAIAKVSGTVQ
jgi:hypothetical protein